MKRRSRKKGRPRGRVVQHGRWWWAKFAVNGERVAKRSNVPADDPEGRELAEKFLVEELAKADLHRGAVVRGRLKFEQLGTRFSDHRSVPSSSVRRLSSVVVRFTIWSCRWSSLISSRLTITRSAAKSSS